MCRSISRGSWERHLWMLMKIWWWRRERWRVEVWTHMKRLFTQRRRSSLGFTLIFATCRWVWLQCLYEDWNRIVVGSCVVGLCLAKKKKNKKKKNIGDALETHDLCFSVQTISTQCVCLTLDISIRASYNDCTRLWISVRTEVQLFVGLLSVIVSSSFSVFTKESEYDFGVCLKEWK